MKATLLSDDPTVRGQEIRLHALYLAIDAKRLLARSDKLEAIAAELADYIEGGKVVEAAKPAKPAPSPEELEREQREALQRGQQNANAPPASMRQSGPKK